MTQSSPHRALDVQWTSAQRRPKRSGDFEPVIPESESGVFPLHQRAMADLFGYNPKSEDLEASMLFIYTTNLYNKNRFPHIRKAVPLTV